MAKPKKQIEEVKFDYVKYEKPFPKTENHKLYHKLCKDKNKRIVIVDGYAGSSKSICAVYYACQMVLRGEAQGIYLVRPNEGIGKDIGFLKGTEIEKLLPKSRQLANYASSFLNDNIENLIFTGKIIIQSLNSLQGMDLTKYVLIVDESQLLDADSMYCILTRGAEKVFLTGDCHPAQCVVKGIPKGKDGLSFLLHYMGQSDIVGIVSMDKPEDIVRQDYMKEIVILLTGALEEWRNK